ncbi:MAG: hypothetical protein DRN25_01930 [Thermoplasmata archaeon]|nr:MAG: hypothetical protein DRN25_01930 [Thermoplasmata archaeon]
MRQLFHSNLKFECLKKCADKCCSGKIEIFEEEIKKIKKLGFKDFYFIENDKFFIKQPCIFLKDNLCMLHREHGFEYKFESCKRFPFCFYSNERDEIVVDINWACPGVGKGKRKAEEELSRMLPYLNLRYKIKRIGEKINFSLSTTVIKFMNIRAICHEILKNAISLPILLIFHEIEIDEPYYLPHVDILEQYVFQISNRAIYLYKIPEKMLEFWIRGNLFMLYLISRIYSRVLEINDSEKENVRRSIMIWDFLNNNIKGFSKSTAPLLVGLGKKLPLDLNLNIE